MKFTLGQLHNTKTPLRLDALELTNSRALIQANSGGGKSWLLRLIAEQCAKHIHIIILDPEGEFSTLREKFDFALVGRGGEMPTAVRSASLLARKLMEFRVSAIVDLYELSLPEKREYVHLFLTSVLSVPRELWHPTLLMLDEAHKFCPESGHTDSGAAVINLMDSGRKRGIAGLLATQRLSKLHKDAAAEANNVIIGRTWLNNDQERCGDLLGMGKAERGALRELKPGQFYAFGPALSVSGVSRFSSAPVATTHPEAGQRHKLSVPQASATIREIVSQIGDLPAQVEAEADAVAVLQKQVSELKRQLAARPTVAVPETKVERVEVPVLTPEHYEQLRLSIDNIRQIHTERLEQVKALFLDWATQQSAGYQAVSESLAAIAKALSSRPTYNVNPVIVRREPAPAPVVATAKNAVPSSHVKLPKAERRILTVLAQYLQGRTKTQVAVITGYAVTGGGFNNALGALRTALYVNSNGELLTITELGLQALGHWHPLPIGQALLDHWMRELPKAERAILQVLANVYPNRLSKSDVADKAGYEVTGGGFNNAVSRLRTLELITGKDQLMASDSLFE